MIGETLGSYRVLSKIGEGGMGTVFLAEHPLIGRRAAVKVLRPQYSQDQEMLARFFTEARTSATLRHPALVDVFDFGIHQATGCAYLIMDFLEGETLMHRLRHRQGLPLATALDIGNQIATGAAVAHGAGIVHRDLKPENIFLLPDPVRPGLDRVKILDFGIAKLTNAAFSSAARTRSGLILGTPLYMSPEQCRGITQIDLRADVYSLGCILFAMVCGRPPFDLEFSGDLISAHLNTEPPRPSLLEPALPPAMEAVILRALAKQPADRYQSMAALAKDLEAVPVGLARTVLLPPTNTPYVRAPVPPALAATPPASFTTLSHAASQTNSSTEVRTRWKGAVLVGATIVSIAAALLAPKFWPKATPATAPSPPATAAPTSPPSPIAPAPAPAVEVVEATPPPTRPAPAPSPPSPRAAPTHVTIEVSNPRAGLTVTVNGERARLPIRLARNGRSHVVRFEAPNFKPETRTIRADRDQRLRLKYAPSLFLE